MTEAWTIESITDYPSSRPVDGEMQHFAVAWRFDLTEGAKSACDYGTVTLEYTWTHAEEKDGVTIPPRLNQTWVAFDDLTEAVVVKWVQDALGEARIQSMKAVLTGMINAQPEKTPKLPPWHKAA